MNKNLLDLPAIALKFTAAIGVLLCVAGISGTVYRIVSLLDEKIAAGITCCVMGIMFLAIVMFIGEYSAQEAQELDREKKSKA